MEPLIQVGDFAIITDGGNQFRYTISKISKNNVIEITLILNDPPTTQTLIIDENGYYIRGIYKSARIEFRAKNTPNDSQITTSIHRYKIDGNTEIPGWLLNSIEIIAGRWPNELYKNPLFQEGLTSFSENLFGEDLVVLNKFPDLYKENKELLDGMRRVISEQDTYLQKTEPDCDAYVVAAKVNDEPYGAIFAFTNKNSDDLMIQGVSKFIIPMVFSLFRPDEGKILPRLNSLLVPAVEELAKELHRKRIIVIPLRHQGKILQKYYGFYPVKIKTLEYPCKVIFKTIGNVPSFAKDIS